MHYLLFLELEGFYAHSAIAGALKPVVVFRGTTKSTRFVLDASPEARARGIAAGMSLVEAKTLLGMEGQYVPWKEEDYRERAHAWLDVAAKYSDVVEPLDQHQALLDLSEHPDPVALARELVRELEGLGGALGFVGVRFGAAGCRWLAETVAELGDPLDIALKMPRRYVSGLSIGRLKGLPAEVRRRLGLLGYSKVGELTQVPYETLQGYFGEMAFDIRRLANGGGDTRVLPLYPERCIRSRFRFEGSVSDELVLRRGLEKLAEKLVDRLREGDWVAKGLELVVEYEEGSSPVYERWFTQPLADKRKLFRALESVTPWPPEEPPVGLRVRLPEVVKASKRQQGLGLDSRRERDEPAVLHAIERLGRTFGEESVRSAAVETPRARFFRAFKDANGWK
jgi:nucleotidyltransferase/DNA polymerase involved in DNA repair